MHKVYSRLFESSHVIYFFVFLFMVMGGGVQLSKIFDLPGFMSFCQKGSKIIDLYFFIIYDIKLINIIMFSNNNLIGKC